MRVPVLAALVCFLAASPAAQAAREAVLTYELMLGGFSIGAAEVRVVLPAEPDGGGAYDVSTTLATTGLLHSFTGFESRARSDGMLAPDGLAAARSHVSTNLWRGEPRAVTLAWTDPDAPPAAEVTPPPDADARDPVPPARTAGSVDPLSGVLTLVARAAAANGTAAPVTVFDGRRLYSLALPDSAPAAIESRGFTGQGWKAQVRYERLGGTSRRYESRPEIRASAWLAPPDALGLPVAVPARIVVPTPGFGALVVELTNARGPDA